MNFFYWLVVGLIWPWASSWFRWHIRGLDEIPRRGGVLLASNHISYLDPIAIGYVGLRIRRPVRFLAKIELFRKKVAGVPIMGILLKLIGQIPVSRGSRDAASSLGAAEDALRAGEMVSIFPEGTISYETFEPMEPKTGAARLAIETGCPVVPIAIWGSHRALTKQRKPNWRPGFDVMVFCGEAIHAEDGETVDDFGKRLMAEIGVLLDKAMLEYPVDPPKGSDWWMPPRFQS